MKTKFSNVLQILTGFLHFITIMAKPMYQDTSLLIPHEETELKNPSIVQNQLKMPPINLNIIVVPIVREPKAEEQLVDYLNNRMELPENRRNEKLLATVVTENMKPVTERLVDFGLISSSNEIDDYMDNKTPAPGIIQPQRERPQPPKPMCKSSQVYDSVLGQCIPRRLRTCPLCGRKTG